MENVHTKGPWGKQDFAMSSEIIAMGQKLVAIVPGRECDSPEEMRANAFLICAAPEMLAALQSIDDYFSQPGEDDWVRFCKTALEPARKAIRLARGEVAA